MKKIESGYFRRLADSVPKKEPYQSLLGFRINVTRYIQMIVISPPVFPPTG